MNQIEYVMFFMKLENSPNFVINDSKFDNQIDELYCAAVIVIQILIARLFAAFKGIFAQISMKKSILNKIVHMSTGSLLNTKQRYIIATIQDSVCLNVAN